MMLRTWLVGASGNGIWCAYSLLYRAWSCWVGRGTASDTYGGTIHMARYWGGKRPYLAALVLPAVPGYLAWACSLLAPLTRECFNRDEKISNMEMV